MKGINIIWKSPDPSSKLGYLRLSIRDSQLKKTKVISLNLPPISVKASMKFLVSFPMTAKDKLEYFPI